jgi:hypothetical protein
VISNVPGPREALYLAGARMEAIFPVSVVLDGVGLNMTVMSYRDHLDFGIIADQGQIPDAWPFMDHLRDALEELQTVLGHRARPKVTSSRNGRKAPVASH